MSEPPHPPPAAGIARASARAAVAILRGGPGDAPRIADLITCENHRAADVDEIERLLGDAPSVVAVCGGDLVGMIYSRPFAPDILEWRNSLVATGHRRTGVGSLLVRTMESDTVAAGYRAAVGVNCWMHVGATKPAASAARAFWHAMGWSVIFATDGSAVMAKHFSRPASIPRLGS